MSAKNRPGREGLPKTVREARELRAVREFGTTLARQQRLIAGTQKPSLGSSSFVGTIEQHDLDGNVVAQTGLQPDGTNAHVVVDGPTPPAPFGGTATGGQLTVSTAWAGAFVDDAIAPLDFAAVEVHAATTGPDFDVDTAGTGTRKGTITSVDGAEFVFAADPGDWWVRFVTRSQAGKFSPASDPVPATVLAAADPAVLAQLQVDLDTARQTLAAAQAAINSVATDLASAATDLYSPGGRVDVALNGPIDGVRIKAQTVVANTIVVPGSIGTTLIADGAVTTAKVVANAITTDLLAANAVTAAKIAAASITADNLSALAVTADKIAANTITGDKINAASVAAAVGTFVKILADNIQAGNINVGLNITAGGSITAGNVIIGQGITTVTTNPDGTTYAGLRMGVPGSADAIQVNGPDGQPAASITGAGDTSSQTQTVTTDPVVMGQRLVGSLAQPENQVVRVNYFPAADPESGSVSVAPSVNTNCGITAGTAPDGSPALIAKATADNGNSYWTLNAINYGWSAGDTIVWSVDVWVPAANSASATRAIYVGGGGTTGVVSAKPDFTKRDQWQRLTVAGTLGTTLTANTNLALYGGLNGETYYYRLAMAENADTPTAFFNGNSGQYVDGTNHRWNGSGLTRRSEEYVPQALPGLMDPLGRGAAGASSFRGLSSLTSTYTGQDALLGQTQFTLPTGRSYQFNMTYRNNPAVQSGSPGQLLYYVKLYAKSTLDGTTPADPTGVSSELFTENVHRTPASGAAGETGAFSVILPVPENDWPLTIKLALGLGADNNTKVTPSTAVVNDWVLTVTDVGSAIWVQPASLPGSQPVSKYVTTWAATDTRVWSKDGSTYKDPKSNAASTYYLRQNWDPKGSAGIAPLRSAFVCNGKATSGTDQGKTMATALKGATIQQVRVYLWVTEWGNDAGKGQVELRKWSGTTLPTTKTDTSTTAPNPKYKIDFTARNQGKWITVPTSWIDASNTGIYINSLDWQFPETLAVLAGAGHATLAYRPQIEVTYSK